MTADDPFILARFVAAQAPVYETVRAELCRGRKESHWMWFVFPQLAGLGLSAMSQRYAIASLEEAKAYLDHPVLGGRLRDCVDLVKETKDRTAEQIFGPVDALKLRSSLTLFAEAGPDEVRFREALARFFAGKADSKTLALLGRMR